MTQSQLKEPLIGRKHLNSEKGKQVGKREGSSAEMWNTDQGWQKKKGGGDLETWVKHSMILGGLEAES